MTNGPLLVYCYAVNQVAKFSERKSSNIEWNGFHNLPRFFDIFQGMILFHQIANHILTFGSRFLNFNEMVLDNNPQCFVLVTTFFFICFCKNSLALPAPNLIGYGVNHCILFLLHRYSLRFFSIFPTYGLELYNFLKPGSCSALFESFDI